MGNNLKNFIYNPAYVLTNDYFKEKLYVINYTNQELQAALHELKFKNIQLPQKWLRENCYIKTLVYGNINKENAIKLGEKFNIFQCNEKKAIMQNSIMLLSEGEQQIYIRKSLRVMGLKWMLL